MRMPGTLQRPLCFIQSKMTRGQTPDSMGQDTEERYPAIHNRRYGQEYYAGNKFGLTRESHI
jgi:hypothetical protein